MNKTTESVERALRQLKKENSPVVGIAITLNEGGDFYDVTELTSRRSGISGETIEDAINQWLEK